VAEDEGDLWGQEIRQLDEKLGAILDRVRDVPDRRRGARLVREIIEVLRKRVSHAAAVRLHILSVVDEENGPSLDVLAEIFGPEGEPLTPQAASKLRKKSREARRASQEGAA
jgi:hypothetical protein